MFPALGLDIGDRRIGVALCDPTGLVASPLTTIDRRRMPDAVAAAARLAREHSAATVVVGLPLSLDGRVGAQAQAAVSFAEALRAAVDVPVLLWNEQFTTAEAERRLRAAGVAPSRDRARVDALAAAIILQEWLDAGGGAAQGGDA